MPLWFIIARVGGSRCALLAAKKMSRSAGSVDHCGAEGGRGWRQDRRSGGELSVFSTNIQNDDDDVYQVTLDSRSTLRQNRARHVFLAHARAVLDVPPPVATLLSARKLNRPTEVSNCFATYDMLANAEKSEFRGCTSTIRFSRPSG
jgi:hypothetical protein